MNPRDASARTEKPRAPLDCLLVHVVKTQTYYPPLNVYTSSNHMAIGLMALAELAERNGYNVRVVHTGLETALDKRFSFADYARAWNPKAIGFSCHFHHALVDTLRLVREARAAVPSSFLFVGGFTASFFARELLQAAPALDAVIRGDAEEPLLQLLGRVARTRSPDLAGVANLIWRRGGSLVENQHEYQTSEDMLNDLVYTRFDLLEHGDLYIRMPKAFIRTHLPARLNFKLNEFFGEEREGIFWGLPVGRGCVSRCFYCGGGARAQLEIARRRGVIFRAPEKVIETIRELMAQGYKGCYLSFDPHPWSQEYYVKLFNMMREQKIEFGILFSAWGLPTRGLLDAFARIATPDSAFLISPETGSEKLRKQCRAEFYTNQELMDTLEYADRRGLPTVVYFSIGVPGDSEAGFAETLALKEEIETRVRHGRVEAFLIEMEPAAPWYFEPESYGIRLLRRSFDDFVRDESDARYSSMCHLGYTSDFFGDRNMDPAEFSRRLLKLRCRHFCEARLKCYVMQVFWFLARLVGLAPRPRPLTVA